MNKVHHSNNILLNLGIENLNEMQIAAQETILNENNILFSISDSTIREVEKTVIDAKCREVELPFWADKLALYLNEFKKRPEY